MEIVKLKIDELKPYEKNAKIHTQEQIEQIKASIEEFGMCDPIGVWSDDNIIVEGHGRLQALKEMGFDEVDCIRLDHLTDEQRKSYTLAHNKLTMNTGFDFDILQKELDELELDMGEFGFVLEEADVDISYIDDLMNNEFAGSNESDSFEITFVFLKTDKPILDKYIKEFGKNAIVDMIVESVGEHYA